MIRIRDDNSVQRSRSCVNVIFDLLYTKAALPQILPVVIGRNVVNVDLITLLWEREREKKKQNAIRIKVGRLD